ncbi:ROK family protein [Virgibacillus dakarensis]|nr:ROK family protein [Virgibacillus dakarensis]
MVEWVAEGDEICKRAIDDFYFILAAGIHNIQHIYDPEKILLGGGVSARKDLIPSITKRINEVQSWMDLNSM